MLMLAVMTWSLIHPTMTVSVIKQPTLANNRANNNNNLLNSSPKRTQQQQQNQNKIKQENER
jgi:hypothetical protein